MTAPAPQAVRFVTREAVETDHPFIYQTFLRTLRKSDQSEGIASPQFFSTFKAQFSMVLNAFTVLIAHPEADTDEIAGWLAFKHDVVGWIYVKKYPWGRTGCARHLFAAARLDTRGSIRALYGSRWAFALARSKGLTVKPVSFVEGTRLLLGRVA